MNRIKEKNTCKRDNEKEEPNMILSDRKREIEELQNIIAERNKKAYAIQSRCDFIIPKYVLYEIIKEKRDYDMINSMIGLSVTAGSLSRENAKKLQMIYKKDI